MKAMILAAGLGTRLKELTKTRPKCLMVAGGKTLLAHVIERISQQGVNGFVINTHYLADKVEVYLEDYLKDHESFSNRLQTIYEPTLLETGGGILNAKSHLMDDDFVVHNADIYSDINVQTLMDSHKKHQVLGTLAVMERPSRRKLLFHQQQLIGWQNDEQRVFFKSLPDGVEDDQLEAYGFSGIYALSPKVFDYMPEEVKPFSIIDTFKSIVLSGGVIRAEVYQEAEWIDIGTPEKLESLQKKLEN